MACHICKVTGERECDPVLADLKCEMCGYCSSAQAEIDKETANERI